MHAISQFLFQSAFVIVRGRRLARAGHLRLRLWHKFHAFTYRFGRGSQKLRIRLKREAAFAWETDWNSDYVEQLRMVAEDISRLKPLHRIFSRILDYLQHLKKLCKLIESNVLSKRSVDVYFFLILFRPLYLFDHICKVPIQWNVVLPRLQILVEVFVVRRSLFQHETIPC